MIRRQKRVSLVTPQSASVMPERTKQISMVARTRGHRLQLGPMNSPVRIVFIIFSMDLVITTTMRDECSPKLVVFELAGAWTTTAAAASEGISRGHLTQLQGSESRTSRCGGCPGQQGMPQQCLGFARPKRCQHLHEINYTHVSPALSTVFFFFTISVRMTTSSHPYRP